MSTNARRISLDEQQSARKVRAPAPRIKDLLPSDHATRQPTPQEREQLIHECIRFCNAYPQVSFVSCPENWLPEGTVARWCGAHKALPTVENLTACFNDIPAQFTFDLSVIGVTGGKVSGDYVMGLPSKDYEQCLKPHPTNVQPVDSEAEKVDAMQSDEYRKYSQEKNPEEWVRPASAFAVNDAALAVNSFVSLHPEYEVSSENRENIETYLHETKLPTTYNNVEAAYFTLVAEGEIQPKADTIVQGKVLKAIDLGGSKPGYPVLDELSRDSLKARIRNMTSFEYDKKLRDDPSFRRAVDSLE